MKTRSYSHCFYHDLIYNASSSGNEEKSAEAAQKRLQQLGVPATKIRNCVDQILATKGHTMSDDTDTNIFTDADLSILGHDSAVYTAYYKNIRKEYSIYPDFMYNPGRKKVLQHFLAMPRIFKTDHFYDTYEAQARINLQAELETLSQQ